MDELTDQSQLGQRGEAWTIAQFVAIALVVLPPVHSTVSDCFAPGHLCCDRLLASC